VCQARAALCAKGLVVKKTQSAFATGVCGLVGQIKSKHPIRLCVHLQSQMSVLGEGCMGAPGGKISTAPSILDAFRPGWLGNCWALLPGHSWAGSLCLAYLPPIPEAGFP
jgi:hypothetical protein